MGNVIEFRPKPKDPKKKIGKPLTAKDIQILGFLTNDDRNVWIKNKEDIAKILLFISRNKITIFEGK